MTSLVFLAYALGHLALFAWSLQLFLRFRHPSTVPLLIVTFGLIYDNAVLAAGSAIGHGDVLANLSVPRFFMHAFGTPLLMLSALGFVRRSGAPWSSSPALAVIVAAITVAMVAVGAQAELLGLELEQKQTSDLISYGNAARAGPPLAPIVTIFVLIAAGVALWRYAMQPWVFAGALAQFMAAAIGGAIAIAGNLGELMLLAGLVWTDNSMSRRPVRDPR